MRRLSALALIAALGAAVVVSEAQAQQAVFPQWVDYLNQRHTVQPGTLALPTNEQYPASTFAIFKPNWLNTTLNARLAGGLPPSPAFVQDSTNAEDVRGANWLAAYFYPVFKDSVSAVAVAIQFRWHFTSGAVDSATTFIEDPVRSVATNPHASNLFVSTAQAISGNTVLHSTAAAASLGNYSAVNIGDYIIGSGLAAGAVVVSKGLADSALTMSRAATGNVLGVTFMQRAYSWEVGTRDSIGSLVRIPATSTSLSRYSVGGAAVANTDSLATPDEQVLVFSNISGTNRGRVVSIRSPDGLSRNTVGQYLSLRVRYLNGYNASGIAWGNGVSGFEPPMRLNVALLGGR